MDTRMFHYVDPVQKEPLSPETRWLLLQWSRIVGLDQPLTCSHVELYSRLGLSPQHAKRALKSLELRGYLIYETVRHGRGRPVSSHRISEKFRHSLEKQEKPAALHQPEITALCCAAISSRASQKQKAQNHMSGQERADMLVPATYWLLAVLLAHAEAPGIVRGLSYGRLRSLTGMKRERLKNQLSKLKKIGIIARHEPGVLRSKEGACMRSVYFLDLAHPLLLGEDSIGLRVVFYSSTKREELNFLSGFYEAGLVVSELSVNFKKIREKIKEANLPLDGKNTCGVSTENSRIKNNYGRAYKNLFMDALSVLPSRNAIVPAASDIVRADRLGFRGILKAHIHSYVTMLLSNHWGDIKHQPKGIKNPISAVVSEIQKDCSSLFLDEGEGDESHRSTKFFSYVYSLAHHVALQIKNSLNHVAQQEDCDFTTAIFSLEPFYYKQSEFWRLTAHFWLSEGVKNPGDALFRLHGVCLSLPEEMDVLAGMENT